MTKEEKKPPVRKQGAKWGVSRQKMMTFRIDTDVVEMLEKCVNKGRVVNDAVRDYLKARNRKCTHESPKENDIPCSDEQ